MNYRNVKHTKETHKLLEETRRQVSEVFIGAETPDQKRSKSNGNISKTVGHSTKIQ